MTTTEAIQLLEKFRAGGLGRDKVLAAFQTAPVADLGFAQVDTHRGLRRVAIDVAPDLGQTGAKAYPIDVAVTMATKEVTVIVFKCISTSIYDFVDPQVLKTLSTVNVYDGATWATRMRSTRRFTRRPCTTAAFLS